MSSQITVVDKDKAKLELAKLIEDFNNNPRKDKLTEEETRSFISKMFEIMGWIFTKGDVTQEEKVSKGYVDYGFKINDIPKMFVEAKKSSNPITDEGI